MNFDIYHVQFFSYEVLTECTFLAQLNQYGNANASRERAAYDVVVCYYCVVQSTDTSYYCTSRYRQRKLLSSEPNPNQIDFAYKIGDISLTKFWK